MLRRIECSKVERFLLQGSPNTLQYVDWDIALNSSTNLSKPLSKRFTNYEIFTFVVVISVQIKVLHCYYSYREPKHAVSGRTLIKKRSETHLSWCYLLSCWISQQTLFTNAAVGSSLPVQQCSNKRLMRCRDTVLERCTKCLSTSMFNDTSRPLTEQLL